MRAVRDAQALSKQLGLSIRKSFQEKLWHGSII
jgi:hypothetical protein